MNATAASGRVPAELLTDDELGRGVRAVHELSRERQVQVRIVLKARPTASEPSLVETAQSCPSATIDSTADLFTSVMPAGSHQVCPGGQLTQQRLLSEFAD